jgi:beta-lactamase class A
VVSVAEEGLADALLRRAASVDARVGYSIVPLDGGASIRKDASAAMPTASAFKAYLLAALYAADASGRLALDDRIECEAAHATRGSGVLKLLAPGLRPTLRDHARLMIVVSDNVATNAVIRALGGPAAADAAVHALPVSLPATAVKDYVHFESSAPDAFATSSPDDFTALLRAIYEKRCTGSTAHDEEVYWVLRRQTLRSMLPRHLPCSEYYEEFGIPEPFRCGSKSGMLPGVRTDIGIVETPSRAWAIAVQVHGEPDLDTGDEHPYGLLIADLSRLVFAAWGT